ncbi:MAG: hypothetical protein O7I42_11965 [Alphaproteobacteria bacterium]|nr:hypothetical protein [Alphaproteobacteria bacterium]
MPGATVPASSASRNSIGTEALIGPWQVALFRQAWPFAIVNSRFPEISPPKQRAQKGTMKSHIQIEIARPMTGLDIVGLHAVPGQDIYIVPSPVRSHANNIPGKFSPHAESADVAAEAQGPLRVLSISVFTLEPLLLSTPRDTGPVWPSGESLK